MGGASSKTTFQSLVAQLLEKDIDANDHEFWDELWKTVLTAEDIFEIIAPDDVRKMVAERPENIKTVFTQAIAQLYQVVETPYPIYFQQASNCARVLTRLLPFLLESPSKVIKELLWSKRLVKTMQQAAAEASNSTHQEEEEEFQESEPLAVILVNTIFHLLFLPDFTVEDPNVEFQESDIDTPAFKSALMWSPGIGSTEKTVVTSTQYDNNRIDVLRLMIASFSDSLFQQPDHYDSCASMWLEVATSVDAPYAEIVFNSLMNTVLGYDPVGWGVPYGNYVTTDTAKLVMEHAIQALIILLDYGHPIHYEALANPLAPTTTTSAPPTSFVLPSVSPHDTQAQGFNVFRRFLGSIESSDQLNFIFQGFSRLLNNIHQAENTYLPYSITRVTIEQELLILLWKCIDEIPKFMPYILKHCDITELVNPICYVMMENRQDPSQVGFLYLCTFTLLKLSGERNFGVALNKPYTLTLPLDIPQFTGNHADVLFLVLHKLIVSGSNKLSSLYSCFVTIICNVSPYCKSLCPLTGTKLLNLLQLFSSPKFFFAGENNYVYVELLLESFNNLVQYQYEGNCPLIYSIIKRRELFEQLAGLSLSNVLHAMQLSSHGHGHTGSSHGGHHEHQAAASGAAAGAAAGHGATVAINSLLRKSHLEDVQVPSHLRQHSFGPDMLPPVGAAAGAVAGTTSHPSPTHHHHHHHTSGHESVEEDGQKKKHHHHHHHHHKEEEVVDEEERANIPHIQPTELVSTQVINESTAHVTPSNPLPPPGGALSPHHSRSTEHQQQHTAAAAVGTEMKESVSPPPPPSPSKEKDHTPAAAVVADGWKTHVGEEEQQEHTAAAGASFHHTAAGGGGGTSTTSSGNEEGQPQHTTASNGGVVATGTTVAGTAASTFSSMSTALVNKFVPTEEWIQFVRNQLPLTTLLRLLKHLVPQVDELCKKAGSIEEKTITDFLHNTTMVGLLPVPHPIVIRKYQPNRYTCLWFTAFQWGVVFMHNQYLPLFDGKHIRLFIVQNVPEAAT